MGISHNKRHAGMDILGRDSRSATDRKDEGKARRSTQREGRRDAAHYEGPAYGPACDAK
jgi:hypothetical protein